MLWLLRIALYIQFVLGLGRYFDLIPEGRLWETHVSLGVLIAALALYALRPNPSVPGSGLRAAARFLPLVTLAVGLAIYFGWATGPAVVIPHIVLGIATVGLVEAAVGRERRARA